GFGGGIPVVAFWTGSVGEAIGHIETLPLTVSLPVKVNPDSRVSASMVIPAHVTLQPGETFFTPRTFIAVFAGDYYEPLRLWSSVLAKEGWNLPKPSREPYNPSCWDCVYDFAVPPAQILAPCPIVLD